MLYTIPTFQVGWLTAKIEKLNRKASKLNCPPVTLTTISAGEPIKRFPCRDSGADHDHSRCVPKIVPTTTVEVAGEPPRLNGWTFAATLQHLTADDGEMISILRTMPGFEQTLPLRFRTANPTNCDHCHTYRQRRDTYVVADDSGQWQQVGSSCLRDFLGHTSPESYARWAELLGEFFASLDDPDRLGGAHSDDNWELDAFLALTSARIRESGWTSRKAAKIDESIATADHVLNQLLRIPGRLPDAFVTDADEKAAAAALEWLETVDTSNNDYLYNIQAIMRVGLVSRRTAGLAASIISSYQREMNTLRSREMQRQRTANSQWLGAVGDKISVTGEVTYVQWMDSNYGGSYTIVKVTSDEGNLATWFASNPPDLHVGDRITMSGKIKRLDTWKDQQSTTMTRCKITQEG